eukprot:921735-Rhodomonas_salina.3
MGSISSSCVADSISEHQQQSGKPIILRAHDSQPSVPTSPPPPPPPPPPLFIVRVVGHLSLPQPQEERGSEGRRHMFSRIEKRGGWERTWKSAQPTEGMEGPNVGGERWA